MRSSAPRVLACLAGACSLAFITGLGAGCHRSGATEVPETIGKPKIDVTYMTDRGVPSTAFQVGDTVFASIAGLQPRGLYGAKLYGPTAAPAAAPSGQPTAGGTPAPQGPGGSPTGGTPAAAPSGQPTAGGTPAPQGPGGSPAGGTPAPQTPSEPAVGPAPPPAPPASDSPAGETPTAQGPGGPSAGATPVPQGPGEPTAGRTPAPQTQSAAPAELGANVNGGTYAAGPDGRIAETQVAREVGLENGSGPGRYTLVVSDPSGQELGRSSFDVAEGTAPVAFACDATGKPASLFTRDSEAVWVTARRVQPNTDIGVFIVADKADYPAGTQLDPANGKVVDARSDASGKALVEAWATPGEPGAYDIVLDMDNNGAYSTGDVVCGGWTAAFVVAEQPIAPGEADRETKLTCGEDYYRVGTRGTLTSADGLFVRGLPLTRGDSQGSGCSIYVCAHADAWSDGDKLTSRIGRPVKPAGGDSTGIPRTLVCPGPLLPGKYDIVVDVNGDGTYTRGVDLLDSTSGGEAGVVITDAGNLVTVKGRVLGSSGQPVAGAAVACDTSAVGQVTTDANGYFALPQVLPIATRVQVTASGFAPTEVQVTPQPTDTEVSVGDIGLVASSTAGNPYFPLVDGGEWKYELKRTITKDLTVGTNVTSDVLTETGTLVRGLTAASDGGFSMTEHESVMRESVVPELAGQNDSERTIPLAMGANGLMQTGPDGGLLLPSVVEVGKSYAAGPFALGPFTVSGQATVDSAGAVQTTAGNYDSCVVVTIAPSSGGGPDVGNTTATGSLKIWLAPDVGEVKREAEVVLDVLAGAADGQSTTGRVTVKESLSLMHADL